MSKLYGFVGVSTCVIGLALYFSSKKDKVKVNKRIQRCKCGKYQAELNVDAFPTSAACFCGDCTKYRAFVEEDLKSPVDIFKRFGAVCGVQVWKKDYKILQGKNELVFTMLRPDSFSMRLHCNCCKTPLLYMPAPKWYPMVIVFDSEESCKLVDEEPTYYVEVHNKQVDEENASTGLPFSFILVLLYKIPKGLLFGLGNKNLFENVPIKVL